MGPVRRNRANSSFTACSTFPRSPPGRAVAIAADDPDAMLFAARNRLYVSRDGGVFWTAVPVELPEIEAVALAVG